MHVDGSAAATVENHNQNSPPRSEVGVSSWGTSSFQSGEATHDHQRQLDTQHHFDMFNWPMAGQEKDRYASLSLPTENVVCNTSVSTTSTDHLETIVIDLKKTQRKTTPRRHKHTPKVIKEHIPHRTPKETCPTVKRKYVRKNQLTQKEVGSTSKEEPRQKRKYVRKNGPGQPNTKRLLDFDLSEDLSLKVDGEASNLPRPNNFEPKVDLDPETERAWKLMLRSEGNEAQDEKTEKWWEEERKLFQGRIESFTARMHLVQGNWFIHIFT